MSTKQLPTELCANSWASGNLQRRAGHRLLLTYLAPLQKQRWGHFTSVSHVWPYSITLHQLHLIWWFYAVDDMLCSVFHAGFDFQFWIWFKSSPENKFDQTFKVVLLECKHTHISRLTYFPPAHRLLRSLWISEQTTHLKQRRGFVTPGSFDSNLKHPSSFSATMKDWKSSQKYSAARWENLTPLAAV